MPRGGVKESTVACDRLPATGVAAGHPSDDSLDAPEAGGHAPGGVSGAHAAARDECPDMKCVIGRPLHARLFDVRLRRMALRRPRNGRMLLHSWSPQYPLGIAGGKLRC